MQAASKTEEDILFIGNLFHGTSCDWGKFKELADIEYDSGYGGHEIDLGLVIIFKDLSRLYREEYDGSEWWNYQPAFKLPEETKELTTVKYDWKEDAVHES